MIKKGNLVEFADKNYQHYPPKDSSLIKFGVAIENEQPNFRVRVKVADGSIVTAKYIYAYAWGGWMPEDLEAIYEEVNSTIPDNMDYFDEGY